MKSINFYYENIRYCNHCAFTPNKKVSFKEKLRFLTMATSFRFNFNTLNLFLHSPVIKNDDLKWGINCTLNNSYFLFHLDKNMLISKNVGRLDFENVFSGLEFIEKIDSIWIECIKKQITQIEITQNELL